MVLVAPWTQGPVLCVTQAHLHFPLVPWLCTNFDFIISTLPNDVTLTHAPSMPAALRHSSLKCSVGDPCVPSPSPVPPPTFPRSHRGGKQFASRTLGSEGPEKGRCPHVQHHCPPPGTGPPALPSRLGDTSPHGGLEPRRQADCVAPVEGVCPLRTAT